MKLKRFTALMLAVSLSLLPGCGSEEADDVPQDSETPVQQSETPAEPVAFTLPYDATDALDPLAGTSTTNQALAGLVYQGLFELDTAFAPQPLLCASYTVSEDQTVWTFTLRDGVTFSDGTPLTAAHVAASLNTARSSTLYAARLAQVASVKAGENTVTVTLSAPNGTLPALLDIPITLPAAEGDSAPLGTGPYYYDAENGEPVLTANPNCWQQFDLPVERIPLHSVSSADDRIAAFDTGVISLISSDLTGTNALGYSGSYETWDCPTTSMLYLGFNCASGPCQYAALRQAISRSIDRSTVATTLLSGHAAPAVLPVSPASALYDETLADELGYSMSAAAQLLQDGGYSLNDDGVLIRRKKPVELTLLVNTDNSFRVSIADYLATELSKLGLTVTVTKLPWTEFLTALQAGQFDLYLAQVKMTADFDPTALLTGSLNYGGFWSENTNALLAAFRAASDDTRADAASALYADLASALPFTPLCFLNTSVLTQWGMVSGLDPTPQNPFYHFHTWEIQ